MTVVQARKTEAISKSQDPKRGIQEAVGSLDEIAVYNNNIIVGTYIRNEKRASGLYIPQSNLQEDEYQGKVGLVLKKGPLAFCDEDFMGQNVNEGDWVVYRVNDGWQIMINGVSCRILQDIHIRLKVDKPDVVF